MCGQRATTVSADARQALGIEAVFGADWCFSLFFFLAWEDCVVTVGEQSPGGTEAEWRGVMGGQGEAISSVGMHNLAVNGTYVGWVSGTWRRLSRWMQCCVCTRGNNNMYVHST